jgi:hypothetical protein
VQECDLTMAAVRGIRRGVELRVPGQTPPIRVVAGFVRALDEVLAGAGDDVKALVGCAVIDSQDDRVTFDELGHLLSLAPVGTVIQHAVAARVVLVLPDRCYDTVVRPGYQCMDLSTFLPVGVGSGGDRCWIHVPGYPAPPGLRSPQPTQPAPDAAVQPAPANGAVSFTTYGDVHGGMVAGDVIHGNQYIIGGDPRRA